MTTISGVILSGELGATGATSAAEREPAPGSCGDEALRPYIELARELVTRLGCACPSPPTNRRSVE